MTVDMGGKGFRCVFAVCPSSTSPETLAPRPHAAPADLCAGCCLS